MMTSSNGNICRFTGRLCGEFTGHWLITLTKASDTELRRFLWSDLIWVNNREAGDLRRHRAHYDVTVMKNPVAEKKNLIRSSYALNYNHCIWIYSPSISYHRFRSHVGASSQQNLQKIALTETKQNTIGRWIIPLITVGICRRHKW